MFGKKNQAAAPQMPLRKQKEKKDKMESLRRAYLTVTQVFTWLN
jgi:hypothetical protein